MPNISKYLFRLLGIARCGLLALDGLFDLDLAGLFDLDLALDALALGGLARWGLLARDALARGGLFGRTGTCFSNKPVLTLK